MIVEKNYIIGNRDIDACYKATNKAMMEYLENIACIHSDKVGEGISNIDVTKSVWILLDWKFKVIERPIYGQTIKVRTWSRKMEKCSAYRDFQILDKNGDILAIATSKWVLLNAETRKIKRIQEEVAKKYESENTICVFNEELEKLLEPENEEKHMQLKIRKTDIDINNHVNNLNYLDLAYEILPDEVYKSDIKNVRITYKHQTNPGEIVNLSYMKKNEKNVITIKTENKETLHSIIELW